MEVKFVKVNNEEIKNFQRELWTDFWKSKGKETNFENITMLIKVGDKNAGYTSFKKFGKMIHITEIIIKSEFRNNKIGHKVLKFIENFAIENKCHKIRLSTSKEYMPSAYYLYKKHGFNEETILHNDYWNSDWIILSKFLDYKN